MAAYFGALALIAWIAVRLWPEPEGAAPATEARQWWVEVERPQPAFAIAFPDMPGAVPAHRILRDPVGGGRRDILTAEGEGWTAQVELLRPGRGLMTTAAPAVEIAQRAAETGAVEAVASAPAVDTRFGKVDLVDFARVEDGRRHGCLGFVRRVPEVDLELSGWVCHASRGMVARTAVVCALDRLTLLSAGGDARLAQFFAHAELKDEICKRLRPLARRSADWIDRGQAVRLRGTTR
ncbi:MAG TPA: hypothetical protein VNR11_14705 [Xanthobacteraceae bacterium]|nr:hypothetical protein [Xanthobacteraceae bacterium]